MLLLLVTGSTTVVSVPSRAVARGTATIRIEHPAIANKEAWEDHPMGSRKEVILYDKLGRPVLVRLIECQ
jgi:hypothetical protein